MEYAQFIEKVREYAGLTNTDEALRVTKATLETLGERLSRIHRHHLASQLSNELKKFVLKRNRTERFALKEFYNRVSARADTGLPHTIKQSQAVMRVLQEAVAKGELDDIISELPEEYSELLGKKPSASA